MRSLKAAFMCVAVIIIGVLVTVVIIILIIVGAWFIYTTVSDSHPEWLQTIPGETLPVSHCYFAHCGPRGIKYYEYLHAVVFFVQRLKNLTLIPLSLV